MKKSNLISFVVAGVTVILVLIPFHAFLTVWAASAIGHYTIIRLWKELLLVPLFVVSVGLAWRDKRLRHEVGRSWVIRLMAAYALLQLLLGLAALAGHRVNRAALAEGLIEDGRLVAIFFIAWVAAGSSPRLRAHWQKIVLIPGAIVVVFGLLQATVLPADFLGHFGYGPATIKPYELVDLNSNFVRVQSSLRGPNPLGAYLIVVLAAVTALLGRRTGGSGRRRWLMVLGAASIMALYCTYSRSAYAGAALAVFTTGWFSLKSDRLKRWLLIGAAGICVVFGGLVLALRHNTVFEDTFFHTSQLSRSPQSSNQNRALALENGVRDVLHEPLGRGPGTAGPASVHNDRPARIAENYYLQIGQELGWLGLAIFAAINVLLAKALWQRRAEPDGLPLALLASFIGLFFVNMLSHAWADDTLAYLWWGLAGIASAIASGKQKIKG